MLTLLYTILAAAYYQLLHVSIALFMVIFTFAQFFLNFGPNLTTVSSIQFSDFPWILIFNSSLYI